VWQLLAGLVAIVFLSGAILVIVRGVVLAPIAALGESWPYSRMAELRRPRMQPRRIAMS
jgi:hypothetical protein